MARPTFTPVYEEDENTIKDRMLARLPGEWRKEPGDFAYDTIATSPLEVKQLQINQDNRLKHNFAQYAEGEFLDLKLAELGLTRGAATVNRRTLQITADAGVLIPENYIVTSVIQDGTGNPLEFTLDADATYAISEVQAVPITCSTTGAATNLPTGTEFLLKPPIPGVRIITDLGTNYAGQDTESDESAWSRYDYKLKHPDTGGNKHDYVRWSEEVTGVGKAKCIPRWAGNNTVKVILLGADFKPASGAVVADVQEYLDPDSEGLGEGKAPCGSAVTVVAATELLINVTATVTYLASWEAAAKAAFEAAINAYLKDIALVSKAVDPTYNEDVVYQKIAALLINTQGVANFTGLIINGGTADIPVPGQSTAVKGTVTI